MGGDSAGPRGPDGHPAADAAELAWDAKQWAAVREAGFGGPLFDRLLDQLIRYALPRLRTAIRTGKVFPWCRQRNPRIRLHSPRWFTDEDHDELASAVVAKATARFERTSGTAVGWNPCAGASLATFFLGLCIDEFPNEFHSWLSRYHRHRQDVPYDERGEPAVADPCDVVLELADVQDRLRTAPAGQRAAIWLHAQGFTHREIADKLGTTTRAVEALIRRARRRLTDKERGRDQDQ